MLCFDSSDAVSSEKGQDGSDEFNDDPILRLTQLGTCGFKPVLRQPVPPRPQPTALLRQVIGDPDSCPVRARRWWKWLVLAHSEGPESDKPWTPQIPAEEIDHLKSFFIVKQDDDALPSLGACSSITTLFPPLSKEDKEQLQTELGTNVQVDKYEPSPFASRRASVEMHGDMTPLFADEAARRVGSGRGVSSGSYESEEGGPVEMKELEEDEFVEIFSDYLKAQRPTEGELRRWFRDIDVDFSTEVSWNELFGFLLSRDTMEAGGGEAGGTAAEKTKQFTPSVNPETAFSVRMATHKRPCNVLCTHPQVSFVVSGGGDGFVKCWDPQAHRCVGSMNNSAFSARCLLAPTKESNSVATSEGHISGSSRPPVVDILDAVFNTRGTHCFIAGADRSVNAYDYVRHIGTLRLARQYLGVDGAAARKSIHWRPRPVGVPLVDITLILDLPDISSFVVITTAESGQEKFFFADKKGNIIVYPTSRLTRAVEVLPVASSLVHEGSITKLRYEPSLNALISIGWDRRVRFTNPETLSPVLVIGERSITAVIEDSVSLAESFNHATSGSLKKQTNRNNNFNSEIQALLGLPAAAKTLYHKQPIMDFAYSPKLRILATCDGERCLYLWNIGITHPVGTLYGHSNQVIALAYDPSGEVLVSLDTGGLLRLWDLRSHRCVQTINMNLGGDTEDRMCSTEGIYESNAQVLVTPRVITFHEPSSCLIVCGLVPSFYVAKRTQSVFTTAHQGHTERILSVMYMAPTHTVVTADAHTVLTWNLLTGRRQMTWSHEDIDSGMGDGGCCDEMTSSSVITAVCGDRPQRRVFDVDNVGTIKCYNYRNGSQLMQFNPEAVLSFTPPGDMRGLAGYKLRTGVRRNIKDGEVSSTPDPVTAQNPEMAARAFAATIAAIEDPTVEPVAVCQLSNEENTVRYLVIVYPRRVVIVDESIVECDLTSDEAKETVMILKASDDASPSRARRSASTRSSQSSPTNSHGAKISLGHTEQFTIPMPYSLSGTVACAVLLLGTSEGSIYVLNPTTGGMTYRLVHPPLPKPLKDQTIPANLKLNKSSDSFSGLQNSRATPRQMVAAASRGGIEDMVRMRIADAVLTVTGDNRIFVWDMSHFLLRGIVTISSSDDNANSNVLLCVAAVDTSPAPPEELGCPECSTQENEQLFQCAFFSEKSGIRRNSFHMSNDATPVGGNDLPLEIPTRRRRHRQVFKSDDNSAGSCCTNSKFSVVKKHFATYNRIVRSAYVIASSADGTIRVLDGAQLVQQRYSTTVDDVELRAGNDPLNFTLPILHLFRFYDSGPLRKLIYISDYAVIVALNLTGQSVQLYTLHGERIGTFGQQRRWNIKFKTTFEEYGSEETERSTDRQIIASKDANDISLYEPEAVVKKGEEEEELSQTKPSHDGDSGTFLLTAVHRKFSAVSVSSFSPQERGRSAKTYLVEGNDSRDSRNAFESTSRDKRRLQAMSARSRTDLVVTMGSSKNVLKHRKVILQTPFHVPPSFLRFSGTQTNINSSVKTKSITGFVVPSTKKESIEKETVKAEEETVPTFLETQKVTSNISGNISPLCFLRRRCRSASGMHRKNLGSALSMIQSISCAHPPPNIDSSFARGGDACLVDGKRSGGSAPLTGRTPHAEELQALCIGSYSPSSTEGLILVDDVEKGRKRLCYPPLELYRQSLTAARDEKQRAAPSSSALPDLRAKSASQLSGDRSLKRKKAGRDEWFYRAMSGLKLASLEAHSFRDCIQNRG